MRSAGITLGLLFAAALSLQAQPPGALGLPPAAPPAADPILDTHLDGWEKATSASTNFSAKFELSKVEATFKKERKYNGSILCMKPNLARMSQANLQNKNDFEAYICNGKSLFHYDWPTKIVTEIPLIQGNGESLMLDFLAGMKASAVKQRFTIALFNPNGKVDPNYVYFDIKPKQAKDRPRSSHSSSCRVQPGTCRVLYQVHAVELLHMVKPNDDTEHWKLSEQAINIKKNKDNSDLSPKIFEFEQPKEKDWQFKKASLPPPPGGPNIPGALTFPPARRRQAAIIIISHWRRACGVWPVL